MKNKYHSEYIYLNNNYYKKPKETFKFIFRHILKKKKKKNKILDLGCSRGELLFYLSKRIKNSKYVGIDNSKTLISHAKKQDFLKNIIFLKKNLTTKSRIKLNNFNIITALGLIETFQDLISLKNFFYKIKYLQKKNSYFFLFGRFNKKNVDVVSNYLNYNFVNKWQTTSTWSEKSIISIARKNKYILVNKKKFYLPFVNLPKKDPIRAFTVKTEFGYKFMNGLGMIFNLTLLIFKKL